ncbi:MAG: outer membrane protein assembly factor BamC [Gammaproteobacteria bacterium]
MLFRSFWLLVLSALLFSGCSRFFPALDEMVPDKRKEYQRAESLPDLEIPPDLSSDTIKDSMAVPEINQKGAAAYSTYQDRVDRNKDEGGSSANHIATAALGDETAIAVSGTVAEIWPRLIAFWRQQGYPLDRDDRDLGVIETAWREDRQALVRDKFKLFVEPSETPSSSTLFLSHKGERMVPEGQNVSWTPRERDERLEKTLAGELQAALKGALEDTSPTTVEAPDSGLAEPLSGQRARLLSAGGNKLYLTLPEDFSGAWRDTGLALEHARAITIEDRDRTRGVYYIRYASRRGEGDSEGSEQAERSAWSKLAFWKGDDSKKFQISVTGVGPKTEIVVLEPDGRWDQSKTAAEILELLRIQLNNAPPVASTLPGT